MFLYQTQRELHLEERVLSSQHIIFDALVLGIASPEQIRSWAERRLSNGSVIGEVLHSKTVDYKTFKPLRDGLFCERIFGPVADFRCSCGKEQPSYDVRFCPDCEVDYCRSTARRHRLGYIDLFSSVSHLWYLKGRPNSIAVLLNKKPKHVETLIYCATSLVDAAYAGILPSYLEVPESELRESVVYAPSQTVPLSSTLCCDPSERTQVLGYFVAQPEPEDQPIWAYARAGDGTSTEDNLFQKNLAYFQTNLEAFQKNLDFFLEDPLVSHDQGIQQILTYTGGEAVKMLLGRLDLVILMQILAYRIAEIHPQIRSLASRWIHRPSEKRLLRVLLKRRLNYTRRFKIAHVFHRTKKNPGWMILSVLPVLPPNLRPILVIDDQLVASDVNRLYQRVLFRNIRLKRSRILDLEVIGYSKRLLQEAVDALIENGKGGMPAVLGLNDRPLKSLSDRLKGKRGRFRQNLLGKRVDYSGRSVIVVGPKMRLHECGLPREMALELFSPFLIRRLIEHGYVKNLITAKKFVDLQHPIIWPILTEIMPQLPILLNRAPTLHRLGIQAFQPHLVAGQAILLHPLVCSAFNADFDGDQMAVHIPLSFHARAEAWKLLWSRNNLLTPATGQPILIPSQDMVLGCYYLTTDGRVKSTKELDIPISKGAHYRWEYHYFNGYLDALQAFSQEHVDIHTPVWLKLDNLQISETGNPSSPPSEIQIDSHGSGIMIYSDIQEYVEWSSSTNQNLFQESFWKLKSQYILTTIGRILVNQLFDKPDIPITHHLQRRIDKLQKLCLDTNYS